MEVLTRPSRKKTWQTGRERVSVDAVLAIQKENVVQRLVRLRTEIGHPEKLGEPLPQDQAAARAGVTARQWQRWESGASVPYARNLSAVADAFGFDVAEFYDGPAGQEPASTPTPFAGQDGLADQLDAIQRHLADQSARIERIELMLLGRADSTLVSGEDLTGQLDRLEQTLAAAISEQVGDAAERLDASVAEARSILRAASQGQQRAASKRAPKRTRTA